MVYSMRLHVKVISNAKRDKVSKEGNGLKVRVKVPAVKGKANRALVELLAGHFKVKKSDIKIIRGEKSREKVVEIDVEDVGVAGDAG